MLSNLDLFTITSLKGNCIAEKCLFDNRTDRNFSGNGVDSDESVSNVSIDSYNVREENLQFDFISLTGRTCLFK